MLDSTEDTITDTISTLQYNIQINNILITNKIILLYISLITGHWTKMASFYHLPSARNLMLAGTNC
jgi:hypothetical protein